MFFQCFWIGYGLVLVQKCLPYKIHITIIYFPKNIPQLSPEPELLQQENEDVLNRIQDHNIQKPDELLPHKWKPNHL